MESTETSGDATGLRGDVVLGLCSEGRDELRQPQAGLSLPQRRLLKRIDGRRSLKEIAGADATLRPERVARDAALLLGLGLVELEHGMLQPITRPSALSSRATGLVAAAPRTRSLPPATGQVARPAGAADRRHQQWSRVLPALLAGGALVALAVHSLRPVPPVMPAAVMTPKPITRAPSVVVSATDGVPAAWNGASLQGTTAEAGSEQARLAQR